MQTFETTQALFLLSVFALPSDFLLLSDFVLLELSLELDLELEDSDFGFDSGVPFLVL